MDVFDLGQRETVEIFVHVYVLVFCQTTSSFCFASVLSSASTTAERNFTAESFCLSVRQTRADVHSDTVKNNLRPYSHIM